MSYFGGKQPIIKISRTSPRNHTFSRFQRWIEVREKISDWYKPTKIFSRYAHESIKPRLYQTGALEVGAEKKFQLVFLYVLRALGGGPQFKYSTIQNTAYIHVMYSIQYPSSTFYNVLNVHTYISSLLSPRDFLSYTYLCS